MGIHYGFVQNLSDIFKTSVKTHLHDDFWMSLPPHFCLELLNTAVFLCCFKCNIAVSFENLYIIILSSYIKTLNLKNTLSNISLFSSTHTNHIMTVICYKCKKKIFPLQLCLFSNHPKHHTTQAWKRFNDIRVFLETDTFQSDLFSMCDSLRQCHFVCGLELFNHIMFVYLQAFSRRQTTLQCLHHDHCLLPAHVLMPDPPHMSVL